MGVPADGKKKQINKTSILTKPHYLIYLSVVS